MYLAERRLVVSPSDLVGYLACEHLTSLSLQVAANELPRPIEDDPVVAVVQRRGNAHEARYLATLAASGQHIVAIDDGEPEARAAATERALASGPDVLYQATFYDAAAPGAIWRGHADFLTRIERTSALGSFSYEPEDTKLARHVRPSAVIQLCEYAEQLAVLQDLVPEQIYVVLGGEERVALRLAEFSAYYRAAKREFEAVLGSRRPSYPVPAPHCAVCAWRDDCDAQRLADDHLSLVAGLSSEQARRLTAAGITTVAQFATSHGAVHGIGNGALERLRAQAALQVAARTTAEIPYQLLEEATPGIGLGALPPPDAGDLFFDIEGDPYVGDGGIEYLLGVGWQEDDGTFCYRAFWAHTEAEEKRSFEAFIDFVTCRRATHPGLHVFHYAPYEPSALGRLMGRHGTREAEVDELLRGDVLIDLYRVVRQALRVGTPSYSLKKLEALYRRARTEAVTDAGSSIVEYERWLEVGGPEILDSLEEYNRVDCLSTRELRDWLEARRPGYEATFGVAPARPAAEVPPPPARVLGEGQENAALRRELLAESGALDDPDGQRRAAGALLGELLDWHRREDRPKWWQFFQRVFDCDESDLFLDTEAIGGLQHLGIVAHDKRSVVRRYGFDPAQDFKLGVGAKPVDPLAERAKRLQGARQAAPGEVVAIDVARGEIELRRQEGPGATLPGSLIPAGPPSTAVQHDAIGRVARSVISHGIDGPGPYRAARDLLLRRAPRTTGGAGLGALTAPNEAADDGAVRLALALAGGQLSVQGPPGSGKTSLAARIAVALVRAGKTVGVTANSHAVITNLLDAIVGEADRQRVAFPATQKCDGDSGTDHPMVTQRTDNALVRGDLAAGAAIIAGTSWLFSRAEFDQSLDYLLIDEAGQFSLANTIAVATAATNIVLVGDPRQLPQPSGGSHPPGVDVSALDHLLAGAETMPDDLGIFLNRSHRLHPGICAFISEVVYAGRLASDEDCARQSIGGSGPLAGAGLRWVPVDHRGNRVSSPEEVEAVRGVVDDLLGRPHTDKHGAVRELGLDDIVVVAPYNAQVAALVAALPSGARVGTVDKFQGQEAVVVITSLATSDLTEIPRGMEFLYSINRLNVAVSRAQALAVLVASPALLRVRCHTVEQMRLANGLCRYVELADAVGHEP